MSDNNLGMHFTTPAPGDAGSLRRVRGGRAGKGGGGGDMPSDLPKCEHDMEGRRNEKGEAKSDA